MSRYFVLAFCWICICYVSSVFCILCICFKFAYVSSVSRKCDVRVADEFKLWLQMQEKIEDQLNDSVSPSTPDAVAPTAEYRELFTGRRKVMISSWKASTQKEVDHDLLPAALPSCAHTGHQYNMTGYKLKRGCGQTVPPQKFVWASVV